MTDFYCLSYGKLNNFIEKCLKFNNDEITISKSKPKKK